MSEEKPVRRTPPTDIVTCDHDWREVYYGNECTKCGLLVIHGSEPWMPEQERPDSDFCPNCGHDLGDISDYGCWYCTPGPVLP